MVRGPWPGELELETGVHEAPGLLVYCLLERREFSVRYEERRVEDERPIRGHDSGRDGDGRYGSGSGAQSAEQLVRETLRNGTDLFAPLSVALLLQEKALSGRSVRDLGGEVLQGRRETVDA